MILDRLELAPCDRGGTAQTRERHGGPGDNNRGCGGNGVRMRSRTGGHTASGLA